MAVSSEELRRMPMEDISNYKDERCTCVNKRGVILIPIIFALVMICGFTTTYIVAVTNDHVRSIFPYISDTGNFHPESSVFTLVCCIAAMLGLVMFFIHYKHAKLIVEHRYYRCCNSFSLFLGICSVTGLLLIASFQDGAKLSQIHYIGAMLTFGIGSVYCFVVTLLGWHISVISDDRWLKFITPVRILLCILMLVGAITVLTATVIADHKFDQYRNSTEKKFKWGPHDKAFSVHLVATGAEWSVAFVSVMFFLTFVRNFYVIEVEAMIVKLKEQRGYTRI